MAILPTSNGTIAPNLIVSPLSVTIPARHSKWIFTLKAIINKKSNKVGEREPPTIKQPRR